MANMRLDVDRDAVLVRKVSSGADLGAGNDHHLGVGRLPSGNYIMAFILRLEMPDWTGRGIHRLLPGSTLKLRVRGAHSDSGSSARFFARRVTSPWTPGTWGGQGHGDVYQETWSSDNAVVYNEPDFTTAAEIDTGGLGSPNSGAIVTLDIDDFMNRWAPPSVMQTDGVTPCLGFSNYGLLFVSFDTASSSRYIDFDSMEGSTPPYGTLQYSSNAIPSSTVWASPVNGATIASTTPTLTFSATDADDTVAAKYDLRIDEDSGSSLISIYENAGLTTGITGLTVSLPCPVALTRGYTYEFWSRVADDSGSYGAWGVSTVDVNSTGTPAITDPAVGGYLARLTFQSGWNTPRLSVAHAYSDPDGHAQSAFRWTVYNSNSAGTNLGLAYQTAFISGTATTYVIPFDLANGGYYLLGVETKDSLGTQSPLSPTRLTRARWARAAYYIDCSSAPASWTFAATTTVGTPGGDIVIEFGGNTTTAAPSAYVGSVGSVTPARYFHYRVWIMAWGSAAPTSPTLAQAVLTFQGASIIPDGWLITATAGVRIDTAEFVYGQQSLRIDGVAANTGRWAFQGRVASSQIPIVVQPNTDYRISAKIKNTGFADGRVFVSDQNGTVLAGTPSPPGDTDWALYASPVFNSGSNSTVYVQPWMDGLAGTTAWFDAIHLEASRVITPWSPGLVGRGVAIDAGGVQVNAAGGAVFRLIPTTGSVHVVEMGAYGLTATALGLRENSSPANPPAGSQYLFIKASDHKVYRRDSTGAETLLA